MAVIDIHAHMVVPVRKRNAGFDAAEIVRIADTNSNALFRF